MLIINVEHSEGIDRAVFAKEPKSLALNIEIKCLVQNR